MLDQRRRLAGIGLVSPDLAQVGSALLWSDEVEMLQRHITPGLSDNIYPKLIVDAVTGGDLIIVPADRQNYPSYAK